MSAFNKDVLTPEEIALEKELVNLTTTPKKVGGGDIPIATLKPKRFWIPVVGYGYTEVYGRIVAGVTLLFLIFIYLTYVFFLRWQGKYSPFRLDKYEERVTIPSQRFVDIIEGQPFDTDNKESIRVYLKQHCPGQVTPGQSKKKTKKNKPKKAGGVPIGGVPAGGASILQLQPSDEEEDGEEEELAEDVASLQLQTSDEEGGEKEDSIFKSDA